MVCEPALCVVFFELHGKDIIISIIITNAPARIFYHMSSYAELVRRDATYDVRRRAPCVVRRRTPSLNAMPLYAGTPGLHRCSRRRSPPKPIWNAHWNHAERSISTRLLPTYCRDFVFRNNQLLRHRRIQRRNRRQSYIYCSIIGGPR